MGGKAQGVVGPTIGLTAASLLAAQSADAATQLGDIADLDKRVLLLGSLLLPVIGWVAFNILPGLFNQLKVSQKKGTTETCQNSATCMIDSGTLYPVQK
jgi:photosystem II PsbY protein